MPRTLQEITADAIWSLHCQGFGTGEIRSALLEDRAGIGRPVDLTKRTIQRRRAKCEAEGRPRPKPLEPGEESTAARALLRTYLGLVSHEVDSLEKRQALGDSVAPQLAKLLAPMRAVGEILRVTGDAADAPTRAARGGRQKGRSVAPASALERIGQELERQPAETAADPAAAPVDGNGAGELEGPRDVADS